MTNEEIETKFNDALDSFIEVNHELLWFDASERAISHKFAEHLQHKFQDWHVDCEYNRLQRERQAKVIRSSKQKYEELIQEGRAPETISYEDLLVTENLPTVFPDIIVHHRGVQENLLVIEIKKAKSPNIDWDRFKVEAYVRQLDYQSGVLLVFVTEVESRNREQLIQDPFWICR
jgi:hypothetical protein